MIRLVVALRAEARPLIRRFELTPAGREEFPLWRGSGIDLVISGMGREAATAATAWLGRRSPGEAAWINVGIGGHRDLPLGQVVLAHKVVAADGGAAWYPPLVFEPPCATAMVTTVDRPETGYGEETIYEMEAAGFCAAAARLVSAELIQVIKVVSDNAAAPPSGLTAKRVEELIEGRIETIAHIAEQTAELASRPALRPDDLGRGLPAAGPPAVRGGGPRGTQ